MILKGKHAFQREREDAPNVLIMSSSAFRRLERQWEKMGQKYSLELLGMDIVVDCTLRSGFKFERR